MKKSLTLIFIISTVISISAQTIPYGNNPEKGEYFEVDGVKLYYEIYGKGKPILMLHGGVFGYIDEFSPFIPKLAETHQVICLATRGHGKSEIGKEANTYTQRANDAYQLLQHLKIEKAAVLGFSDGGYAALKMAARYPKVVTKLLAIGVGDKPLEKPKPYNYTSKELLAQYGDFFKGRMALMPEPDRWDESLQMLSTLYNEHALSTETFEKIECPVLLMNGAHDEYTDLEGLLRCYNSIEKVTLSVIPACGHVIFFCNFPAVWESMQHFLKIE